MRKTSDGDAALQTETLILVRFFFGVKNRSEDEENLRLSEATKLKQRDLGVWEKQREERGTEAIDN